MAIRTWHDRNAVTRVIEFTVYKVKAYSKDSQFTNLEYELMTTGKSDADIWRELCARTKEARADLVKYTPVKLIKRLYYMNYNDFIKFGKLRNEESEVL